MENRRRRRVRVRVRVREEESLGMLYYGAADEPPRWDVIGVVVGGIVLLGLFVAAIRA